MKTIVRIEHISGDGIWRAENKNGVVYILDNLSNYLDFSARHKYFKTPFKENLDFVSGKHFCAFKSIDQLQEWVFPEEIRELLNLGFKVLLLDVSEWLEGEHQICFQKEHIIKSKDISELFK